MSAQFALNTAATAMDHADTILGTLLALVAREGWAQDDLLTSAIVIRRDLQAASDAARLAAMNIHNERRRFQRMVGAPSLSQIA